MLIPLHSDFSMRLHPRYPKRLAGEDVRMSDGSIWFHPYNGASPFVVRKARKTVH